VSYSRATSRSEPASKRTWLRPNLPTSLSSAAPPCKHQSPLTLLLSRPAPAVSQAETSASSPPPHPARVSHGAVDSDLIGAARRFPDFRGCGVRGKPLAVAGNPQHVMRLTLRDLGYLLSAGHNRLSAHGKSAHVSGWPCGAQGLRSARKGAGRPCSPPCPPVLPAAACRCHSAAAARPVRPPR
jgi:hypothetical protein